MCEHRDLIIHGDVLHLFIIMDIVQKKCLLIC